MITRPGPHRTAPPPPAATRHVPWTWRRHDALRLEQEWDALLGWLEAWMEAYEIEALVPPCWDRHGPVVEHLVALHRAHLEATLPVVTHTENGPELHEPTAVALCTWQNVLMPAALEVVRRQTAGCGTEGHVEMSGADERRRRTRRAIVPSGSHEDRSMRQS